MSDTRTRIERAQVTQMKLTAIQLSHRRREGVGAISALAKSLKRHGLIHPITVRTDGRLVAGGRRYAAALHNGSKTIRAFVVDLSDEELMAIELAENEHRSDLDAFAASMERTRQITALAKQMGAEDRAIRSPKSVESLKTAARERLKIPKITANRDRRIIADVREFPALESWSQRNIKRTADAIRDLPVSDHNAAERFAASFDPRDAHEAAKALEILGMPDQTPAVRKAIFKQATSKDPKQVEHAQSAALQLPPAPDSWYGMAREAQRLLKEITKHRKNRDSAQGRFRAAYQAINEAVTLLQAAHNEAVNDAIANLGGSHQ